MLRSVTWDEIIAETSTNPDLSPEEREKVELACDTLRRVLGRDLTAFQMQGHEIIRMLGNSAPWTRRWMISLSDAIGSALHQRGSELIIKKLRKARDYREALLLLDTAKCFIDSGFRVEFLDVRFEERTPDMKIINPDTNEEVYVEVTEMGSSLQTRQSSETSSKISLRLYSDSAPNGIRIRLSGSLHKFYLSEPNLQRLLGKIDEMKQHVGRTGFEEYCEEGVIELAFATLDNLSALRDWSARHGITGEGEFSMPILAADETYRIGSKITDKRLQLREDHPNILLVRSNSFFMHVRDIPSAIRRIEENVFENRNLTHCIILGGFVCGSDDEKLETIGSHLYLVRNYDDALTKKTILVENAFVPKGSLTEASSSMVRQAIIGSGSLLY